VVEEGGIYQGKDALNNKCCLGYVLDGQLNREIAAELNITETTVKVHRGRVMEKLGVQSTSQPLFSRRRHHQLLRKRQHSGGRPADSRSR
jgi:DNA-binding CsgD family transcriptional regulator